jgi:hypothetical protein
LAVIVKHLPKEGTTSEHVSEIAGSTEAERLPQFSFSPSSEYLYIFNLGKDGTCFKQNAFNLCTDGACFKLDAFNLWKDRT